jgi:hypothetical protein
MLGHPDSLRPPIYLRTLGRVGEVLDAAVTHRQYFMVCEAGESRMFNGRYTIDPLRVALSLIAGAATYAILTVLWFLSHVMWGPIFPGDTLAFAVYNIFWSVIYFIFWGVILIVFGLPVGLLLYKLRLQYWLVAVVVGGAMTSLVALALVGRGSRAWTACRPFP